MPNDPFTAFVEGYQNSQKMGLLKLQALQGRQEFIQKQKIMQAEAAKAEFDQDIKKVDYLEKQFADPNVADNSKVEAYKMYIPLVKKTYGFEPASIDNWDSEYTKAAKRINAIRNNPDYAPDDKLRLMYGVYSEVSQAAAEKLKPQLEQAQKESESGDFARGVTLSRQIASTPGLAQYPEIMNQVMAEKERLLTMGGTKGQDILAEGIKKRETPEKVDEFQTFKTSYLKDNPNTSGADVVRAYKGLLAGIERPATQAQMATIGHALRQEIRANPYVKDFQEMDNKFSVMEKALEMSEKTKNFVAVDQALITLYNKVLDPQSVVRESEYARTPENLSLINQFKGKIEKYGAGGSGITQKDRQALVDMALLIKGSYMSNYDQTIQDYKDLAKETGMSEKLIGIPYERKTKIIPQKHSTDKQIVRTGIYND